LQLKGIREAIAAAGNGSTTHAIEAGISALSARLAEPRQTRVEVALADPAQAQLGPLLAQQSQLTTRALELLATRGNGSANSAEMDERLGQVSALLHRLSQQLERGAAGARRVDVELDVGGPSNFYRSLSSTDVFNGGGLFVATYEKPPPLGADVLLSLRFPTGPSCELPGNVAWVRDELGEHAPPGFGVRFSAASPEARALVKAYADAREPMLYDA
jgi:Tfp pilus assembly protein PilZ